MSATRPPPEVNVHQDLPVLDGPRLDLAAPDVGDAQAVAGLLADRVRASILTMLAGGPHCVCELSAALGERENNVSNHLARLREAGLVHSVRRASDGRYLYYERDEAACAEALRSLERVLG